MQDEYNIEKIFEQIENDLISSMKRTLWYHKKDEDAKNFKWSQWQALKLKQLEDFRKNNQEIFKNYNQDIKYATKIQMKKQFREGASRTNKQAIKAGVIKKEDSQLSGSFFGLNDRKIKALIKSTTKDINDVKYATLRMANDQYRQIIYKAEVYANTGAKTVQQAIDMATKEFLAKGFNCIEYSNGSRHNIADYCDMAIRTANKRANLMGEGEMRKKLNNPLVYISKHSGACDKCSPWQGRVYIDDVWSDGKKEDGKYPLLSTAIAGGLFHPRCQHGSSTYYPDINDEPEEVTQALSGEHEDEYTQALQRQKRQYERLALGSLLPENVLNYQYKVNELQNQIESSKMEIPNVLNEVSQKYNQTINENAKKFIDKTISDSDIIIDIRNEKALYTDTKLKKIVINPKHDDMKYYKIDESIIHEIIHLKDLKNNIVVENYSKMESILKKAKMYTDNNKTFFYNFLKENETDMATCDILSALTKGELKGDFGHTLEYWKNDTIILQEIAANMLSSYIIGNKKIDKLLKEIPPLKELRKECLKLWGIGN